MQHNFEVLIVQLLQHLCRIGKNFGVERERTMPGIPSRWAKARAQINQRVAWEFFLAKGLRNVQHFIAACQGAMRLHIAQRPQRR